MKLNRSKFTHYLDMFSFIVLSIVSSALMLFGIFHTDHSIAPSMAFIIVYLMNLIYYRLCLEFENSDKYAVVFFLSLLYLLGIFTTITLLVYLIYFAWIALHNDTLIDVLSNHIFYATITGCAFSVCIAIDNTTTLYSMYTRQRNNED